MGKNNAVSHNYNTRSVDTKHRSGKLQCKTTQTPPDDESESETESESESESESEWESDNSSSEEAKFDVLEYRKLLSEIFPSNYSKRARKSSSGSSNSDNSERSYTQKNKKKRIKRVVNSIVKNSQTDDTQINKTSDVVVGSAPKMGADSVPNNVESISSDKNKNINTLARALSKMKSINTKKFIELLEEKNNMNDIKYFKDIMTDDEQKKAINDMNDILSHCRIDKPYRIQLLGADIPSNYKAVAYKKISGLSNLDPGAGEFYKLKQWVDTFMQIPFGKYKSLPVTLNDNGLEECAMFMDNAKKQLDCAVYGMNDAKLQIMQLIGQWITNPSAMGTAIAIKGPMGTGKTTLVKEGISKVLGRDFSFMALGGATDSSFLEGHSYTYEGAAWGKIIDNIVQCKSMNPVFFFDELDKVSDTPKGEEIIGILTHLTDTSQNSKFHDKYFSEIDFDLSKCLFIFSYNDESKINPILLDRMYRVQTKGYDVNEKIVIANQYLLPKIREQVCFNDGDILIPDETMKYIISQRTDGEQGIRNLKRCLEIIYTKMNLYRLMRPGTNMFEKEMNISVKFPMTITNENADKLITLQKTEGNWRNMYI